jgi:hypothetical protein
LAIAALAACEDAGSNALGDTDTVDVSMLPASGAVTAEGKPVALGTSPIHWARARCAGDERSCAALTAQVAVDNSFIEGTQWTIASGNWFTSMSASMTVPAAPVATYTSSPQMFDSMWPGIEDAIGNVVIQPVLFYGFGPDSVGGNHWTFQCYVTYADGTFFRSSAITVNQGDSLTGTMVATNCNVSGGSCSWTCTVRDNTTNTTQSNTHTITETLTVAFGGLLEVRQLPSCFDFPVNGPTTLSNIALFNNTSTQVTPTWGIRNFPADQGVACGFGVADTSTTTTLEYTGQICTPGDDRPCCPFPNGCSCDGDQTCNAAGTAWGRCIGAGQAGHPCP